MMAATLLDAPRLTLSQAARKLGVHSSAIYRWANPGLNGVRLPITRIGGRSYVLLDDLERFVAQRSDPRPHAERAASRDARADDAGRTLDALGL